MAENQTANGHKATVKDNGLFAWLQSTLALDRLWAGRYGKQFDGKRDLVTTLGYISAPSIQDFIDYSLRGLGTRIVELFPKDTWATPPIVQDSDRPGEVTDFKKDWESLVRQHDIWGYMHDLDLMAQIGEYAVLLAGVEGVQSYASTLVKPSRRGPTGLRFLRVYKQDDARIQEYETDKFNQRYGRPNTYELHTKQISPSGTSLDQRFPVHYSHLLHFADNTRDSRILGQPLLLRVIDAIFDLMKMTGGIAEMVWRDGRRRIVAEVRDGYKFVSDIQKQTQAAAVEQFAHDWADFLRVDGIDVKTVQGTIPQIDGNILRNMQVIAGILDVPMRKLFGSEMGQLATDQDNEQYAKKILARYERIIIPRIIRPFIDWCIELGLVAAPENDDYTVLPPDLLTLSPDQQATIDRRYIENVRDWVGPMGEPETILTREEMRIHGLSQWMLPPVPEGGFLELDDDDIEDPLDPEPPEDPEEGDG